MKNKSQSTADATEDVIAKALEAATLATEAAHEAEAVLTARSDAAQSMDRIARRSSLLAAVAGGSAVLILMLGGLLWLRSSADLRDAGDVQAAASAAFVERLTEMNSALDRLDRIILSVEQENGTATSTMAALVAQLDSHIAQIMTGQDSAPLTDQAVIDQIERLRVDMVEALAETQITLTERLTAPPVAAAAQAQPPKAPVKNPPTEASAPKPAKRPAPPRPETNPFRFP